MAKSGRLELGDNIYGQYRSIQPVRRISPAKNSKSTKKRKEGLLRRKVIEVGTNRKPVCDFLLVINSNRHHISYRFRDKIQRYRSLLFKFWTLCVFEPPFGGLGTTYDDHLRLIGKRVGDFLLALIEPKI